MLCPFSPRLVSPLLDSTKNDDAGSRQCIMARALMHDGHWTVSMSRESSWFTSPRKRRRPDTKMRLNAHEKFSHTNTIVKKNFGGKFTDDSGRAQRHDTLCRLSSSRYNTIRSSVHSEIHHEVLCYHYPPCFARFHDECLHSGTSHGNREQGSYFHHKSQHGLWKQKVCGPKGY